MASFLLDCDDRHNGLAEMKEQVLNITLRLMRISRDRHNLVATIFRRAESAKSILATMDALRDRILTESGGHPVSDET